jgi:hypothetical protein
MNNARVYVPQQTMRRTPAGFVPLHDLSPAMEFGRLNILLPSGPVSLEMGPIVAIMREKLETFGDDDFIIATGDPAVISAAVIVAAARNNGRVKLLRWDRNVAMYMALQIDLHEGAKDT